ncbi:MAG TPA: hypothetical protein VFS25_22375 [Chitinophaga sp.]|uniref:hypothetical protein n=1 Tax=Chitinophaga sp. TaxID=1869181 RepID=UPI002DB9C87D|nr:hypothetical protein [Chitinophaga sp.]HEU4555609.1 hypothetical protein [Chitinophaga sp.]
MYKFIMSVLGLLALNAQLKAQTGTFSTLNFPNTYTNTITTVLATANFRSGFVYQSNGSINFGLTGLKQNNFRFRWLAHDNGPIDYTTDTDQVMYLDGNGNLGIKGNITNSGNVGVGTSAPVVKLSVWGPADNDAAISLQSGSNSRFYLQQGSNLLKIGGLTPGGDGVINVASTGYVGIGIPNPNTKLTLQEVITDTYAPSSSTSVFPNGIIQNITNESGVNETAALMRFTIKHSSGVYPIAYIGAIATSASASNAAFVIGQRTALNAYSERLRIDTNGNVGIGTTDSKGYKQAVAGDMIAEKIKVKQQSAWPDYVFADQYQLPSLQEVEQFVKTNKHLPDMPTAEEVKKEGMDVEEMNRKLLQKVEELTLYVIELKKETTLLKQQLQEVRNNNANLNNYRKDEDKH